MVAADLNAEQFVVAGQSDPALDQRVVVVAEVEHQARLQRVLLDGELAALGRRALENLLARTGGERGGVPAPHAIGPGVAVPLALAFRVERGGEEARVSSWAGWRCLTPSARCELGCCVAMWRATLAKVREQQGQTPLAMRLRSLVAVPRSAMLARRSFPAPARARQADPVRR